MCCPKPASLVGLLASFPFSFPPSRSALLCVTSFVRPHIPHLRPHFSPCGCVPWSTPHPTLSGQL